MVVFSKMDNGQHPKDFLMEIGWRAEYYSDDVHMQNFPVGVAYVLVMPSKGAQLNFITVADQWRRQGIATEIIKACQTKWPGLQFTGGMDKAGKSLLSKFVEVDEDYP